MNRLLRLGALAGALAVLAAVAAGRAEAHFGAVQVSCTQATFSYSSFPAGASSAAYTVTVDGNPVASGSFTVTGPGGSFTVALAITGTHAVSASTSWSADGGGSASSSAELQCGTTTPPPTPPGGERCPPGMTPTAGKDGKPGNQECEYPPSGPAATVVPAVAPPPTTPPAVAPPTVKIGGGVTAKKPPVKPKAKKKPRPKAVPKPDKPPVVRGPHVCRKLEDGTERRWHKGGNGLRAGCYAIIRGSG